MKIKLLNGLLIVDILTILLIPAIVFTPSSVARIILGLPFLLFSPGYALVAALFVRKKEMNGIERLALSFGFSIAVVALIGLCLNYTPWGIRLMPILFSVVAFIIAVSAVALIRHAKLFKQTETTAEFNLRLPGWGGSTLNKSLTIILIISVLSTVGVLGYSIVAPKTAEEFSQFYILGLNGKAQEYPAEFILAGNLVTEVQYSDGGLLSPGQWGNISLGIVNNEQRREIYTVIMKIDGDQVDINYAGNLIPQLGPVELQPGEKWEQQIGLAPQHTGNNQKVEFLLYKAGTYSADNSLHFWINVKAG